MNTMLDGEIGSFKSSDFHMKGATDPVRATLKHEGRPWRDIRAELIGRKAHDFNWRAGRLPLYVYHDNEELLSVSREAYNLYFSENALGRRAFPSVAGMEDEVVRTSLSLFHAPDEAVGSFTSGGTESLFLMVKTARDYFKRNFPNAGRPRIVLPRTAHPAFDKAARYLEVDVIRTAVGSDLRADVSDMLAAIDDRTMLIAGSAPCYPYGVFDPIALLGKIAATKRVWLHVDACLGGFLAPFARDEGYPIPEFDFSIPGVSSLSADLHKFGFSARGASVILYRSAGLQAFQGFHFDNWPRGAYGTETFLGSRPAGSIASAWAVFQYLGRAGYRRLARKIMEAKDHLVRGIETIDGLEVVRPSELNIVLYRSNLDSLDIDAVADVLSEKGWFVGRSREPRSLHFALNTVHAPVIEQYVGDLNDAVHQVRLSGRVGNRDDSTY